jgi:hypothetical protein
MLGIRGHRQTKRACSDNEQSDSSHSAGRTSIHLHCIPSKVNILDNEKKIIMPQPEPPKAVPKNMASRKLAAHQRKLVIVLVARPSKE